MARMKLSQYEPTDSEIEAAYASGAIVSQTAEEAAMEEQERARGTRLPKGYQSAADHTGEHTPKPAPSLIDGILRQGHKMMITAASKQGKSWLTTDLGLAIATGGKLFGRFKCRRGRVIYVNAELDEPDFWNRVEKVAAKRGIPEGEARELFVAHHTRGRNVGISDLVDELIGAWEGRDLAAVIIDPVYKYEPGDENKMEVVGKLLAEFDRLANTLHCAVIFVHHHAKGAAGSREALDRGAGSGGFGRDCDAHLDLTRKCADEGSDDGRYLARKYGERTRVYQAEFTLRSFEEPSRFTVVWQWPLFTPVEDKRLDALPLVGSYRANSQKGGRRTQQKANERKARENAIMADALAQCASEKKEATRENVYPIYCVLAKSAGEVVPKEETFKSWVVRKGAGKRFAYHIDTERGNVIVPDNLSGDIA